MLNNRLTIVKTPQEKDKTYLQYNEYHKESKRLLNFCEKMIEKREKGIDSLELEQPEGVPEVKEIPKEKLDEKIKEIIGPPQYVEPIGKNTLPPRYSREISRYEPPKSVENKETEELIEKVKEMTNEGMKGDKREKSVEVDTDLSWDHEGLKPIPKVSKNKLDMSPKPPRIPRMLGTKTNVGQTSKEGYSAKEREINEGKYPEVLPKTNESKEIPSRAKQNLGMDKGDKKFNEKLDLEKSSNPVDKKTARWIEEQNELMGKQREQGTDRDRKERDVPTFSPSNSIKVLQRAKSIHHTNYERPPQYSMGAQGGQAPQLPMIATNQRNGSWVNQGKRYPLKERFKNQWGGYGKQYGTNSEKGGYQTYKTDGNQAQGHGSTYGSLRRCTYNPTRGLESGQGGDGGNGDENDKKRYHDTKVSQENDSGEEESDTEDSYEFEITSQQLSQITPGGGALKIKLSKKRPLKITAGAPGGSQTIPMELEHIPSPKRLDPRSQVDTTSESTLPTRGTGAPLFISPILSESDLEPLEETSPK